MQQRSAGGLGLTLALLSAATFGTSGSFAASLIAAGWTPGAAVTVRALARGITGEHNPRGRLPVVPQDTWRTGQA